MSSGISFGLAELRYSRKLVQGLYRAKPVATRTLQYCNSNNSSPFNNGRIDTALLGATAATYRISHYAPEACFGIRLSFGNWYQTSGVDTSVGNAITVKAGIEYNGQIYPVTFNGAASVVIDGLGHVVSDPVMGLFLPDGATFATRTFVSVASSGMFIPAGMTSIARSGANADGDGRTLTTDLSWSTSAVGTASGTFYYGPCAITGIFKNQTKNTFALVVDSIGTDTGDSIGNYGYILRGLNNNGAANLTIPYAYAHAGRGGATMNNWALPYQTLNRWQMVSSADWALYELGINDISSGLAAMKTRALAAWATLAAMGMKVCAFTLTPLVSNANLTDAALQAIPSAPNETARTGYNDWLRSGQAVTDAAGTLTKVLDCASVVEVNSSNVLTQNGGRWLVDAGPTANTTDGTHPNSGGHTKLGAQFASLLSQLA